MAKPPPVFTKKYARKDMTAQETVADLDRRYWNMRHVLLETIARPTGNTYVIEATHREGEDHGSACVWCQS